MGSGTVSFQSDENVVVVAAAAAAKSLQSCLTLCDPIDGSPPGSPVPGIFQARVLEWGAIAFSDENVGELLLIMYFSLHNTVNAPNAIVHFKISNFSLSSSNNLPIRTCLLKGSPSSLSRRQYETQEEASGAEPQFLFHGCEMPRML